MADPTEIEFGPDYAGVGADPNIPQQAPLSPVDQVIAAVGGPDPIEAVPTIDDQLAEELSRIGPDPVAQPFDASQWADVVETPPEIEMEGTDFRPVKGSASSTRSFAGVTQKGLQTTRPLLNKMDAGLAQDQRELDARFGYEAARFEQDFGAARDATMRQGEAYKEHYDHLRGLERRMADFYETRAELEKQIALDGKAERQKILSDYTQQLAGVRALAATTGNPMATMGSGTAGAMGAALFAQGFLAAQGVNINVGGQIDKWVDRSLQEHQMRVQNARANAQDTLHLYDIARQTAEDDWEARERYRGFVMEGFKHQIQMEAQRFGSSIALERAKQKAAEIDIELGKVMSNIGDRREAAFMNRWNRRLEEVDVSAKIAHQKELERIAWAAEARQRAAQKAKEEAAKRPLTFADPGAAVRGKDGKVIGAEERWYLDPNIDMTDAMRNDAVKRATDAGVGYSQLLKGVAKLRQLGAAPDVKDYQKRFPGKWEDRFNEDLRNYKRQVTHTIRDLRHSTAGATLTGFEKEEWDQTVNALDSMWESGSNAAALEQLEGAIRDKYTSTMDYIPGMRTIEGPRPTRAYAGGDPNATDAAYSARFEGEKPLTSAVNQAIASGGTGRGRNEVEMGQEDPGGFSQTYWNYLKRTGGRVDATSNYEHIPGQTRAIDMIDRIATLAIKPELSGGETVDGQRTDDPEVVRRSALTALSRMSKGEYGLDGQAAGYARELERLVNDPWTATNPDAVYNQLATKFWPSEATDLYNQQSEDRATEFSDDVMNTIGGQLVPGYGYLRGLQGK